jgi:hypothetical protein
MPACAARLQGVSAAVIPFVKGHGLGNDYLVVRRPICRGGVLTRRARAASAIASRHRRRRGPRSRAERRADAGVRIFNPDGSEAEKSGNGLRIFAKVPPRPRARRADVVHGRDRRAASSGASAASPAAASTWSSSRWGGDVRGDDVRCAASTGDAVAVPLEAGGERSS